MNGAEEPRFGRKPEPGLGDDIPCSKCGSALDTGLECTECGHDMQPEIYPPKKGDSPQAARLIELLRSIRPTYGSVGSRDVDVAAQQSAIDEAIPLIEALAAPLPQPSPDSGVRSTRCAWDCDALQIAKENGFIHPEDYPGLAEWLAAPKPSDAGSTEAVDAARYRLLRCYHLSGSWPHDIKSPSISAFSASACDDRKYTLWRLDNLLDEMLGRATTQAAIDAARGAKP